MTAEYDETGNHVVYRYQSKELISKKLADFIFRASGEAIARHGTFLVAISGGSLPKILASELVEEKMYLDGIEWQKWQVFFADERSVPHDHADSNYRLVEQELLSKVPIPRENVHAINAKLVGNNTKLAEDYQNVIMHVFAHRNTVKFPVFDLILLGMGPDGHTCSLFPGHKELKENTRWVLPVNDSPKPPKQRITLTLPVLNHAHCCLFVVTGSDKNKALKRILVDGASDLPSGIVCPVSSLKKLVWLLDDEAAADIPIATTVNQDISI